MQKLFGFTSQPEKVAQIIGDPGVQGVREFSWDDFEVLYRGADEPEYVLLWEPHLKLQEDWKRGAQGIGDCVSWGWELACTHLQATSIAAGENWEWKGEFATESKYGLMRVEVNGGRLGGYSDGSYGAAAAKAVTQYGCLLRQDYSAITGNSEHDLTKYDKKRAKEWGNYGCGGKDDKGVLDLIAKEHPVKTAARVTSFKEAAEAIKNGYPVAVCSSVGFNRNKRDVDGFCSPSGSWPHCMEFGGWRGGKRPGLLCFNSWGRSVSGPVFPDYTPDNVGACSWWVDADVCDRMLRSGGGDSYAVSDMVGFKRRDINWDEFHWLAV